MKKDEVALRVEELIRKAENVQELSESAIKLGVTEMAIDEKNAPRDRLKAYELLGKAKDRPMWGDRSQSDDPPSRQQVIAQFAVFLPVVGAPKVVEMLKLAGIEATEGELSG